MFELYQFLFIFIQPRVIFIRKVAISKTLYSLVHQPSFRAKMILKNTFTFTFTGTLSRGFGLRSFRPKLTNLNILIIGKSVFVSVFVFVFVEWAFTVNLRPKKNSSGRNLRRNLRTKTPQAEASGKCATIFFAPPPPLQIKLGGPIAVNCSGIHVIWHCEQISLDVDGIGYTLTSYLLLRHSVT